MIQRQNIMPPGGVTAAALGSFEIEISWEAQEAAERYHVTRRQGTEGLFVLIAVVDGTSYIDTGLESGETYCYRVFAVCGEVTSEPSEIVCAATFGDMPEPCCDPCRHCKKVIKSK